MTDAPQDTPANKHKVDVGNNMPLASLYILGAAGLVIGNIIVAITAAVATSSAGASGSLFWATIGNGLANGGLLFFVGALVAHAINWQIGRSGSRR
ncbi:MAG: hypothetical protein ABJA94_11350 [Rhodoglobus sp.]